LPRKILLADDSVTAQNMGRKILTEAGYEVITVNNGAAAIKKIAEIKPDLVVLDVHMPGYSGLEVCQRLRETPKLSRVPVLLTVGKLEPFRADDARRVKADAYVIKPFEATELLAVLTRLEDKIVPPSLDSEDDEGGWRSRLRIPAPYMKREESPVEASKQAAPAEPASPRVDEAPAQPRETESEKVAPIDQAPASESVPAEAATDEASPAPVSMAGSPAGEFSESALQAETGFQTAKQEAPSTTFSIEAEAPIAGDTPAAPELPEAAAASTPAPEIPTADDVTAALASLVPAAAAVDQSSDAKPAGEVPELITAEVAVDAGADTCAGPRWIADEVPVSEEESGLVLELEMQRAYAAFAAADAARWGNYSPAVSDATQPEPATSQPEAAAQPTEATYDAEAAAKVAAYIDNEEDLIYSEIAAAAVSKTAESVQPTFDAATAVAAPEAEEKAAYAVASAGAIAVSPGPVEVQPAAEVPCAPAEPASPEHEAELATAWDHWKHIRESVANPEFAAQIAESAAVVAQERPSEPGLESAQAEPPSDTEDDADEIASIVDSVLADLKPKLMQEIAKKMGKSKKK
jgi:CheY-like chemotaxis protein